MIFFMVEGCSSPNTYLYVANTYLTNGGPNLRDRLGLIRVWQTSAQYCAYALDSISYRNLTRVA